MPRSRSRRALLVALLCGMLLGPLAWTALSPNVPAAAQDAPPLAVVLFTSVSTVRPGGPMSISLTGRTTSSTVRPVTLQLVVSSAATITKASTPNGACTTSGTTATCQVSLSSDAPASVTAQVILAATASGTLTITATAQGGTDTASADPVTVTVTGDPLPTATTTPTVMPSATNAITSAATSTPFVVTATATNGTDATATPAATATPVPPGSGPDRCEPNDTLVQPCALQSETDIADLTFVDGTPDVYSFSLKAGRTYTIRAASTTGIDPVLTVYLAGAFQTPLATNDDAAAGDPAAIVQVMTATDAWYIVEVTNKAPGDMHAKTYTLSARSSAPVGSTPASGTASATSATATPTTLGDTLENNFTTDTAVRLAWGVPYDLSLVCPQLHACVSGDHDFFWVPVKAGIPIVAITYDLGPGADTVATLYRPDAAQQDAQVGPLGWRPVIANDDTAPGWTLRSQVALTPNWDGYTLLVIAPSERSDPPALPATAGPPSRYRLIVGSPEMSAVQAVLNAQTDGPPITPSIPALAPPTGQPAAPATPMVPPTVQTDSREVVREASVTGLAVVIINDTAFYSAVPPTEKDLLATYPEGAQVRLLGQTYAGYVKVQPSDAVAPGWMYAPSLRPLTDPNAAANGTPGTGSGTGGEPGADGTPRADGTASADGTPVLDATGPTATASVLPVIASAPLTPLPLPTEAPVVPESRSLTITVCTATAADLRTCATPLADVTVAVLLVANQTVVATARTDRDGQVTLSVSVPAHAQLIVQVAALGVSVALADSATQIPIRMPPQTSSGGAS